MRVDQYFIKWGLSVRIDEACAQHSVWRHTQTTSFRVPQVYHYFEDQESPLTCGLRCGYLVMEFIEDGGTFQGYPTLDELLHRAIHELWTIPIPPNIKVGPLGGGRPQGYLWADDGAPMSFSTTASMNKFMNHCLRLSSRNKLISPIDWSACEYVICHGDLAARNLRRAPDGTLYILDWAFAGVYPIDVEMFSLHYLCNEKGESLARTVLQNHKFHQLTLDQLYGVYRALMVFNIVSPHFHLHNALRIPTTRSRSR